MYRKWFFITGVPALTLAGFFLAIGSADGKTDRAQGRLPLPSKRAAGGPGAFPALPVHFQVRVPAKAVIWFDGDRTAQKGSFRQFASPPLKAGCNYAYRVRARWTVKGRSVVLTRKITVRAGDRILVDFRPSGRRGVGSSRPPSRGVSFQGAPGPRVWIFPAGLTSGSSSPRPKARSSGFSSYTPWRDRPHFYNPADYPAPGDPPGFKYGYNP
jgi:uncharacterized protein (TIGR03000 family)